MQAKNLCGALTAFCLAMLGPVWLAAQTDTLRLVFTGDIMGHSPQIASAQVANTRDFDYKPCFQYIKPILQQADLASAISN